MSILLKKSAPGFFNRVQQACDTCMILWSKDDNSDIQAYNVRKAAMLCTQKGVSFSWLLNGTGLFWHRDNNICNN